MGVKSYAKWVDDTLANTVIENKDLTPPVPTSSGYPTGASISTPTPGKTRANDPSGAALGFASGASSGFSQGKNTTPKTYSKWADKGDTSTPGATPSAPQAIVTPGTIIKNNVQGMIDKAKDTYSKWLADESGKAEGGNAAPSTTPSAPVVSNPSTTAPTVTPMRSESGYAKWLETDPAMQARMRQAESDYYRNRAGYGVQGEHLAQSGLIGSGWDSHLDATAYAAMQAEKAGIRSEGYAKWLGDQEAAKAESAASADGLNTDAQTVFSYLVEQGKESITDTDLSYLYGLGFSKDAIDKAVTAYNDYAAKNKAEVSETIKTDLNKVTESGDAKGFLESVGVDTSEMDDETLAATMGSYVEKAFAEGTITAEDRSKHYASDIMKDIEEISPTDSKKSVASTAAGVIDSATTRKDKLTEADYKSLVDSAFDAINVESVVLGKEGSPADEVRIKVRDNNGYVTEITADWDSNPPNSVEKELTKQFGSASLAVYKDKIYYQYESGGWREIDVKVGWGSEGTTAYGRNILKVVAQYVSDNKLDYRKDREYRDLKRPANAAYGSEELTKFNTMRAIAYRAVREGDWQAYKNGRITREDFIKRTVNHITDAYSFDTNGYNNATEAVTDYLNTLERKK